VINLIEETCQAGSRLESACGVLNISPRTLQRWQEVGGEVKADGRKAAALSRIQANRLSDEERRHILEIVNRPEFASKPPSQIVPLLADQGEYLASESTFYRELRKSKLLVHRGKAKPPTHSRPQAVVATGPNQLWSWDITYLNSTVKGIFFYLYMIMDVFTRKIVAWEIYDEQTSELAAVVFRKAHLREGVGSRDLVLHSDNGSPMKGATLLSTMQKLGVIPSFSRPSVSNDNPYSEALFKTCKYHPGFPEKPFEDIVRAREWVTGFVHWYNNEHCHSGISFVTPDARHRGDDRQILEQRKRVYEAAKAARPERWSGNIRDWNRIEVVTLNPSKKSTSSAKSVGKEACGV
jgi:putative transposase